MSRLDRELSSVYHKCRVCFTLITIMLVCLWLGSSWRISGCHQEIDFLRSQVAGLNTTLQAEIASRRSIDLKTANTIKTLIDSMEMLFEKIERHDKRLSWMGNRITEFNNACDLYCSRSSADYFVLITKIDALDYRVNSLSRVLIDLVAYIHRPVSCTVHSFQRNRICRR